MEEWRWLARYAAMGLAVIGGLEWLLGRTLSRLASAPTLEGTPRDIIEALGRVGFFLVSPAFILAVLLAVLAALAIALDALRHRRSLAIAFAFYLAIFVAITAAHTFLETQDWLNLAFNLLSLIALWWLTVLFLTAPGHSFASRLAIVLVTLAYTGSYVYVLLELTADNSQRLGSVAVTSRDLGELLAVLAPYAFFVALTRNGEWRHFRRWIAPVAFALLFSAGNIADIVFNQGFTGVITTWSLGFNLVWPWPLYAVALALFLYSLLTCLTAPNGNRNTGLGLLFLLLAGYTLQLPYQHLLAILSLLLLTALFQPIEESILFPSQK